MFDRSLILLNLLRLVYWPNMWTVLENLPRALEKNVYLLLSDGMFCVNLEGHLV